MFNGLDIGSKSSLNINSTGFGKSRENHRTIFLTEVQTNRDRGGKMQTKKSTELDMHLPQYAFESILRVQRTCQVRENAIECNQLFGI